VSANNGTIENRANIFLDFSATENVEPPFPPRPPAKAVVDPLPPAKAVVQISPRNSSPSDPYYGVDEVEILLVRSRTPTLR
jgi:hypothetical protein